MDGHFCIMVSHSLWSILLLHCKQLHLCRDHASRCLCTQNKKIARQAYAAAVLRLQCTSELLHGALILQAARMFGQVRTEVGRHVQCGEPHPEFHTKGPVMCS